MFAFGLVDGMNAAFNGIENYKFSTSWQARLYANFRNNGLNHHEAIASTEQVAPSRKPLALSSPDDLVGEIV